MTEERKAPYVRRAAGEAVVSRRLNGSVFFFGTLLAVGLIGLLAAVVTWAFHPTPKPPCTINCPPPEAGVGASSATVGLTEERTFTSSTFGYHVDYTGGWSVKDSSSDGALFSTRTGLFEVVGLHSSAAVVQLITDRINAFDRTRLPDIRSVGTIRGAHLGTQSAQGQLYSGTLLPSSGGGQGLLVRIGIMVARRGNLTVRAMALLPYDQSKGAISGANDVDYGLTEFRWPGE